MQSLTRLALSGAFVAASLPACFILPADGASSTGVQSSGAIAVQPPTSAESSASGGTSEDRTASAQAHAPSGNPPGRPRGIAVGDGLFVRLGPTPSGLALRPQPCGGGGGESCGNGLDDNCNGQIDEGCTFREPDQSMTIQTGHSQINAGWNSHSSIYFQMYDSTGYRVTDMQTQTPTSNGSQILHQLRVNRNGVCNNYIAPASDNIVWLARPRLGDYRVVVTRRSLCSEPRATGVVSIAIAGRTVAAYDFEFDGSNPDFRSAEITFNIDDR